MDCEQALALLHAHMDRELQPDDRPRLEAHLRDCARCRASADAYRLQDADLRRAFTPRRQASAAVANRVIMHLRANSRPRTRAFPWLAVALSAAAGFLIAVLLFRPWTKTVELLPADLHDVAARPEIKTPQLQPETILLALATNADQACEALLPGEKVWTTLKKGAAIGMGTRVRTGPDARCEFHTPDGSEVRLDGGTELVFTEKRRLEMAKGQILARVMEAAVPFHVNIPNAVVTALGTEFDVLCKPVETVLTVLDGATKVEGKDQWRTIQTGEQATIIDGQVVRKRLLNKYMQVASWADELYRLRGPTDKESTRRIRSKLDELLAELGRLKGDLDFPEGQVRSLGSHAVLPLTRYLQSERYKTLQERPKRERVAKLLAEMAEPWSIADLIELLGDGDKQVRFYAAAALKRLTKETLGHEPTEWRDRDLSALKKAREEWREWWAKNKDRFPDPAQIADWRNPK